MAVVAVISVPTPAHAAGPEIAARPPEVPISNSDTRTGVLTLAGETYAYLPPGLDGSPVPLLVVLHGGGGTAQSMLDYWRDPANKHKIVLLIPQSVRGTWDMIEDLKNRLGIEMNVQPRYGRDIENIDTALADLFTKVAIDPKRIGIAGLSDGASYAINVGINNPDLFGTIVAMSPGPLFIRRVQKGQRIFVSHGLQDSILPYSNTRSGVGRLRVKGADVHWEPFKGDHVFPRDIRDKGAAFFMGEEVEENKVR